MTDQRPLSERMNPTVVWGDLTPEEHAQFILWLEEIRALEAKLAAANADNDEAQGGLRVAVDELEAAERSCEIMLEAHEDEKPMRSLLNQVHQAEQWARDAEKKLGASERNRQNHLDAYRVVCKQRDDDAAEIGILKAQLADIDVALDNVEDASVGLFRVDTNIAVGQLLEEHANEIARLRETQTKYSELLYAVAHKFPDETRHETALRYILEAERREDDGVAQTDTPPEEDG